MRKETTVTIEAEGRDKGKQFHLREMPASQAEAWAMKVFHGLAKADVELPEDLVGSGMAGIAKLGAGIATAIEFEDLMKILDEMFQGVQIIPDPSRPGVKRALIEDDIEEVATRLQLRKELLALHLDFFADAVRSISPSAAPAMQ